MPRIPMLFVVAGVGWMEAGVTPAGGAPPLHLKIRSTLVLLI